MSLLELLFPQAELEALGNKWHEPAPKRRKLDVEAGTAQKQDRPVALNGGRRHNSESSLDAERRHLFSAAHQQRRRLSTKSHVSTARGPNRESKLSIAPVSHGATMTTTSRNTPASPPSTRSFLPSFIEPSILQTYLQHLHPNDRSRYSIAADPMADNHSASRTQARLERGNDEDSVSSPSLTADTSSPASSSASSSDNCPTPSAGIFEQLHSGPFSHLIQGLRFTEHERDMVHDLLSPDAPSDIAEFDFADLKAKPETEHVDVLEDFCQTDEGFLHRIQPHADYRVSLDLQEDFTLPSATDREKDNDVHSSGLSPGADEQEEKRSPAGIVMYDYSAFSDDDDDDLFDYDRAAGSPLSTT